VEVGYARRWFHGFSVADSLSLQPADLTPYSLVAPLINELNVRVAKSLTHGRSRTLIAMDIYNALNSSAVLAYYNSFILGGTWLQPPTILTRRFLRITAELDF
jgi:hypothetical protein